MTTYPHTTVKIICDSLNAMANTGHPTERLTTFELTYPRYIHAEIMTHRQLSRNAQSSRAIPVARRLKRVRDNPVTPIRWGKNQKGMQAKEENLDPATEEIAWGIWTGCAMYSAMHAERLGGKEIDLHKQWANRLLEPFDTITVIVTASNFDNLFGLRCHPDAQPEFQDLAWKMADLYYWHQSQDMSSGDLPSEVVSHLSRVPEPIRPSYLQEGEWHLPYITLDEQLAATISCDTGAELDANMHRLCQLSVARCARVSYLTHDKEDPDPDADIARHDSLLADGHMSPFEHQATPAWNPGTSVEATVTDILRAVREGGNFGLGWKQYRKALPVPELRKFNYLEALKTRKVS